MNSLISFFSEHLGQPLNQFSVLVIIISAVLAIAAKPIIAWLSYGRQEESRSRMRIRLMRILNILIIVAVLVKTFFSASFDSTWPEIIIQVLILSLIHI